MRRLFALLLLAPACALAAPEISAGQRLVATCTACHGTDGQGAGNALPRLAGQKRDALLASLRAFRDGTRPATVMHQIAKGYTDEQLVLIADYLAARKVTP